jgi:LmbE family N-acetylglucosaminyl deacetylase
LLIVCAGEKGTTDAGADAAEIARRRALEVSAAADQLGLAGHEMLGYDDGEVADTPELRAALVRSIRQLRPDTVVCQDPTASFFGRTYVNHRDHRIVGWAVLDAVAPAAWMPLYYPETGPPHRVERVLLSGTLEPDVFVDIESALDAKTAALACHRSQLPEGEEAASAVVVARAEDVGRSVGVRYAEGFKILTP